MLQRFIDDDIRDRVRRLDVPFNREGYDPFGISRDHLGAFYTLIGHFYKRYFRVQTVGAERVPDGRAMIIGNHSGGLPIDAAMVIAALFFDREPPRHCHGMVEKFAQNVPFISPWFSRLGQLTGLPEHAVRMLEAERALLVFPEGARGTGKLYKDRYQLVRFGTGFLRIALQTGSPVVPFAFVGGEEAIPTIYHATRLAKLFKAPYFPVTPYGLPVPLPVKCRVHFGEPMRFDGDGSEPDEIIEGWVAEVKAEVQRLIDEGRAARAAS